MMRISSQQKIRPEEVSEFIDFLHDVYADFGLKDSLIYKLSPAQSNGGSDEIWIKAEGSGEALLQLPWEELPGEGRSGRRLNFL